MSNELTLSGSLTMDDTVSSVIERSFESLRVSMNTLRYVANSVSVGTTEEAIPLGEVSSLGWFIAKNLDTTNYVEIRTGTGGTKIVKLKAGESALFRFGSGVTAPFWIADTAACRVEYVLFSD